MSNNIKSKYKLYEEIKILCDHVYHTNKPIPEGWKLVHKHSNILSGFYGEIYQKGVYTVVVYKGSNDFQDWLFNNYKMYKTEEPKQVNEAFLLYLIGKGKNQLGEIFVAGHSLGGSLAQIVAAKAKVEAVTFNAYGTADVLKHLGLDKRERYYAINNFGDIDDKTYNTNLGKQPGKTFLVNMQNLTEKEIREVITKPYRKTHFLSDHFLKTMPPLETSKEITPVPQMPYQYSRKREVYKNLDSESVKNYEHYIHEIREKIRQEEERQKRERQQQENNLINQVRSLCSQAKGNIKMQMQTASGRIENFQSGYIPPQAKQVWQKHFQIKGNSTQDILRQLKNYIK